MTKNFCTTVNIGGRRKILLLGATNATTTYVYTMPIMLRAKINVVSLLKTS